MTKSILQVDPFPDPVHAGQEIEFVGLMFGQILIIISLIILMIYFTKRSKSITSIIVIYLISLIIGIMCLVECFIPYFPWFQVFFILLQTTQFIQSALDSYTLSKKKRGTF